MFNQCHSIRRNGLWMHPSIAFALFKTSWVRLIDSLKPSRVLQACRIVEVCQLNHQQSGQFFWHVVLLKSAIYIISRAVISPSLSYLRSTKYVISRAVSSSGLWYCWSLPTTWSAERSVLLACIVEVCQLHDQQSGQFSWLVVIEICQICHQQSSQFFWLVLLKSANHMISIAVSSSGLYCWSLPTTSSAERSVLLAFRSWDLSAKSSAERSVLLACRSWGLPNISSA